MIKRKKKEGFTLIELLVTITVVSLIMVVTIVFVSKVMETSKEKSLEITKSNILKSASQYTKEFKLEDKYWVLDQSDNTKQYACTTVGMLINKGFLKANIIGTYYTETDKIANNTGVKISRDKNTKVISDEMFFGNDVCSELGELDLTFDISGVKGDNNWYISDVEIEFHPNTTSLINTNVPYKVELISSGDSSLDDFTTSNSNVNVTQNGKNMDLIVTITDINDQEQEFKFSEKNENGTFSIDTEAPTKPNLELVLDTHGNYTITSSDSSDNITNVDYYINNEEISSVQKDSSFRGEFQIESYTKDQAGNKSDSTIKTLKVNDSQTADSYDASVYSCSLYPNNTYENEEELNSNTSNCTKQNITSATPNYTYTCPSGYTKSGSGSNTKCTKSVSADYTTSYSCPSGYTRSGTTCYMTTSATASTSYTCPSGYTRSGTTCTKYGTTTKTYYCGSTVSSSSTCTTTTKVDGWNQCGYVCSSDGTRWYYSSSLSKESSNGCPSGYTKTGWTCNYPCNSGKTASCTPGDTYIYSKGYCYNTCKKTYSATVKYSCASGYTLSGSTCYTTTSATASTTYSCSSGYTLSGTTCTKSTSATATKNYYCDSGSLSGTTCVLSTDPNVSVDYTCSSGVLNGTNCVTTTTGSVTTNTKFICPLTGNAYTLETDAINECTNYCATGTEYNKYNNNCYTFTGGVQ